MIDITIPDKMTASDYHAHNAIGSSAMKRALVSAAHYKSYLENKEEPTPAMILGTAIHSAILEKTYDIYIESPDCRRGTKEWKAFEEQNPGKLILKPDDYATVKHMFEAFYSHPVASKLITGGTPEATIFGRDKTSNLEIKARIDYLVQSEKGNFIVDYKSAQDATPSAFKKAIFDFGYYLSLAHYKDMAEKAYNIKIPDVFIVAQEKKSPYALRIYRLSDRALEQGLHDREKSLYIIKQAIDKDEYQAYTNDITEIDMTTWSYEALNE